MDINNPTDEDTAEAGLDCFLDMTRPCGPSCMAFAPSSLGGAEALTSQQRQCVLLVSAERLGRFLGGFVALYRNAQEDAGRVATTPITGVPGVKR